MHRSLVTLLVLAGMLFGCSSAHEPRAVATGIYDLTARGDVDACSPSRETGAMGLVGIVSNAGVVNVGVPDVGSDALARVSLAATTGFHAESVLAIEGCEGARVRRAWTILDTSAGGFAMQLSEEWTGVAACAAVRDLMPEAPDSDCRADRVLEYRLMETCEAPCQVRVVAGGAACACD